VGTAGESRDRIVGLYRRIGAHSDAIIDALPLDAVGHVPWWPPEYNEVTLHRSLVHTIAEAHRHAGHADIVRELVDGSAGMLDGSRRNRRAGGPLARRVAHAAAHPHVVPRQSSKRAHRSAPGHGRIRGPRGDPVDLGVADLAVVDSL
jgi:hypothetical protein